MQKLLIASDIHGSAHWCARLLERFAAESQGFEPGEVRLLLLGDVLYIRMAFERNSNTIRLDSNTIPL